MYFFLMGAIQPPLARPGLARIGRSDQFWGGRSRTDPRTLHQLYIVNAGSGFRALWKVIKAFMDARTISKIQKLAGVGKPISKEVTGSHRSKEYWEKGSEINKDLANEANLEVSVVVQVPCEIVKIPPTPLLLQASVYDIRHITKEDAVQPWMTSEREMSPHAGDLLLLVVNRDRSHVLVPASSCSPVAALAVATILIFKVAFSGQAVRFSPFYENGVLVATTQNSASLATAGSMSEGIK
ncbi:hypothetical protein Taro_013558 [Colocasia esculenta]|uniref:CRAL-TRIO domain-containing protein n=1 Tax=Colocasia esculenta TaxID=4460 RepID=A0A843UC70_COLES|nr:hypothetical protein [Colocasia esculenta]